MDCFCLLKLGTLSMLLKLRFLLAYMFGLSLQLLIADLPFLDEKSKRKILVDNATNLFGLGP